MDLLPRPGWEDLPADLLGDIALRLCCLADRVHMSRVCTSWAKAERIQPRPRQLPWLLLPYCRARRLPPNIARTAAFFCFPGSIMHHLRVGEDTRGARFFGAYDGGWLFLAHNQTSGHALVNIHTNRRIRLPDSILWEIDGRRTTKPMVILAATLSSPPVLTGQCVVAAIVTTLDAPTLTVSPRQIAFWRLEIDQVAIGWSWYDADAPCCSLQDVIYHDGAFHFVTDLGDVLVIIPDFQEQVGLVVQSMFRHFLMLPFWLDDVHMTARYLVESNGKLLMVVRWSRNPGLRSSGFNIFESWRQAQPNGEFMHHWVWLRCSYSLFFVARGCSRSYETDDFPGSEYGIYFLDDRSSYDVSMIRRMHWDRRYTRNDNGRYTAPPVSRTFRGAKPSNYSSPIWFLP